MNIFKWTPYVIILVGLACGDEDDSVTPPPAQFELVFEDEFDGPAMTSPDSSTWDFDVGGGGFGNNQLEFNTPRTANARVNGEGILEIVARQEPFGNNGFTSARMLTNDLLEVQYGRIEARIKLPTGRGIWPAFWMLGADFPETDWPFVGEIDIMEYCGQEPQIVHGSLHGPGFSGGNALSQIFRKEDDLPAFNEDFHVFAVEWDPARIAWYVDDVIYQVLRASEVQNRGDWVFDGPFFLILNVAVGGTFCQNPDESTVFPQTMEVDYVRVFRRTSGN
ncbi:MAG: family 16 glycosylhydrolase [Myxococcota bacterium]